MWRARRFIFRKCTRGAPDKRKYEAAKPMADFARRGPSTLSQPTVDIRDAEE